MRSISTYTTIGSAPTNLVLVTAATAFAHAGQYWQAVATLTQSPFRGNDNMYEPEINRLKGEFSSTHDDPYLTKSEPYFRAAITEACTLKAKSWELRATTSLARLLAKQDRRDEARSMLADIYDWFTEGFDTADLKDAKVLLAELQS